MGQMMYNGNQILCEANFSAWQAYWFLCMLEESCSIFSRYPCLGGDSKASTLFFELRDYLADLAYPGLDNYHGDIDECILVLASKDLKGE